MAQPVITFFLFKKNCLGTVYCRVGAGAAGAALNFYPEPQQNGAAPER
jgi:hypothetical protein